MIIFGTRVRHKNIGDGEFFCPKCQASRRYAHKRAVRSFTLYFIPIFPIQQLGEFIECQTCGTTFEPSVRYVRGKPAPMHREIKQDLGKVMNSIKSRLDGGYPIEYMVRDLTAAGLDLGIARGAIEGAIGTQRRTCEQCNLTYSHTANTCAECGGALR
ncbi:MAG: zinc-ribbon domain-containing protein [Anaerolineae bacterium]|nr:zinc-ribbon domain-containing protein [Anaerolineae bacterium]